VLRLHRRRLFARHRVPRRRRDERSRRQRNPEESENIPRDCQQRRVRRTSDEGRDRRHGGNRRGEKEEESEKLLDGKDVGLIEETEIETKASASSDATGGFANEEDTIIFGGDVEICERRFGVESGTKELENVSEELEVGSIE
jgi:hypothetical protein